MRSFRICLALLVFGLGILGMMCLGPIMLWLEPRVGAAGMLAIVACSASLLCAIIAALLIKEMT